MGYDAAAAQYGLASSAEGNLSVDDGRELGANYQIVEVLDNGYVTLQQDFVDNIDQDLVLDVFYEIDTVLDFVQTQEINQTYTADVIQTETRTRLAD